MLSTKPQAIYNRLKFVCGFCCNMSGVTLDIKGNLTEIQSNVVECISMHFTDIYFNYLYLQAIALRDKNVEIQSITHGYKEMIKTYGMMIGRPEFIRETIQGIHKQFRDVISVSIVSSYEDCINSILNIFLPEEAFKAAIGDHPLRNQLIAEVIVLVANTTIATICQKYINYIIDERTKKTVVDIQDNLVDDILQVAFDMHNKVKNRSAPLTPQDRVDRVVMEKLYEECRRAVQEKHEMSKKMVALETIIRNKMQKISELEEQIAQLNLRLEDREQARVVGQTSIMHEPAPALAPTLAPAAPLSALAPAAELPKLNVLDLYNETPQPSRRVKRDLSRLVGPPSPTASAGPPQSILEQANPAILEQPAQPGSPTRTVRSIKYEEEQGGASSIINRTVESVNPSLFA